MARRQASKSRARPSARAGSTKRRSRSQTRRSGVRKSGRGGGRAGAFLNFVRSMQGLFPKATTKQLTQDSKAIWREMNPEDKTMYTSSRQSCGPGRMGRRRGRSRSRSRRGKSRSRSRSRS